MSKSIKWLFIGIGVGLLGAVTLMIPLIVIGALIMTLSIIMFFVSGAATAAKAGGVAAKERPVTRLAPASCSQTAQGFVGHSGWACRHANRRGCHCATWRRARIRIGSCTGFIHSIHWHFLVIAGIVMLVFGIGKPPGSKGSAQL